MRTRRKLAINGEIRISQLLSRQARLSPKTLFTRTPFVRGAGESQMQTRRTYQVQYLPNGQWDREHNWRKVEAGSEKEAAEKLCGLRLAEDGKLAQLRARVLTLGDLRQRAATPFYAVE
jgi:hypothetical protein